MAAPSGEAKSVRRHDVDRAQPDDAEVGRYDRAVDHGQLNAMADNFNNFYGDLEEETTVRKQAEDARGC